MAMNTGRTLYILTISVTGRDNQNIDLKNRKNINFYNRKKKISSKFTTLKSPSKL